MVYVGPIVDVPVELRARLGFDVGSRLYADTVEELYGVSRRIGLLDRWIRRDGPRGTNQARYFWVPPSRRAQAVRCGARDEWNRAIAVSLVGEEEAAGLFGEGGGRGRSA